MRIAALSALLVFFSFTTLSDQPRLAMASSTLVDRGSPNVVPNSARPIRPTRLPSRLRLGILVVLNLCLQGALWTAASDYLGLNELGAVSKRTDPDDLLTPFLRLAYKIGVVWLGWKLDYDCEKSRNLLNNYHHTDLAPSH